MDEADQTRRPVTAPPVGVDPQKTGHEHQVVTGLPSQTTIQFATLVAALLASVLVVSETAYWWILDADDLQIWEQCLRQSLDGDCDLRPLYRERLWMIMASLAVPAIIMTMVVTGGPTLRRRRRGLRPVPVSLAVEPLVEAEWRRVGVSSSPRLFWDPGRVRGSAEVWWSVGGYEMELSPGLISALRADSSLARAVVRHEAAHVRNRDVVLGSLTDGAMVAYVFGVAVPFVALYLALPSLRSSFVVGAVQLGLFGFVIALARSAVLRRRELDADAVAAMVEPFELPLQDGGAPGAGRRVADLISHHPTTATRKRVLRSPMTLLDVGGSEGFVAGFVTALYYPVIDRLAGSALAGDRAVEFGTLVAGLVAIPLGLWLGVAAVRLGRVGMESRRAAGPYRLGLSVAAGFGCGVQLFGGSPIDGWSFVRGGWLELLYLTIVMLALVGVVLWTVSVGRLAPGTGTDQGRVVLVVGCATLAIVTIVTSLAAVWRASTFGSDLQVVLGGSLVTAALDLVFLLGYTSWLHLSLLTIGLAMFAYGRATASIGHLTDDVTRAMAPGLICGLATFGLYLLWRSTILESARLDEAGAVLILLFGFGLMSAIGGFFTTLAARVAATGVDVVGGGFWTFIVGFGSVVGFVVITDPELTFLDELLARSPSTVPLMSVLVLAAVPAANLIQSRARKEA